jgi:hypothetical protein
VTRDRLDISRRLGVVAKRGAEFLDAVIDPLLDVDEDVGAPQVLLNGFARDRLRRTFDEQAQQLERLRSQLHPASLAAQLERISDELEDAEAVGGGRVWLVDHRASPAQKRGHRTTRVRL